MKTAHLHQILSFLQVRAVVDLREMGHSHKSQICFLLCLSLSKASNWHSKAKTMRIVTRKAYVLHMTVTYTKRVEQPM